MNLTMDDLRTLQRTAPVQPSPLIWIPKLLCLFVLPEILDIRQELPPRLRAKAESALASDEILLAWFEPDLD